VSQLVIVMMMVVVVKKCIMGVQNLCWSCSYSEDDSISVYDSRPSSSPAYTTTDYFVY